MIASSSNGNTNQPRPTDIRRYYMNDFDFILDAVKEAYIKNMGADKWNALTDDQKHDITMKLVSDMLKAVR